MCQLQRLQYDFVGHMESLEEGVRHVLERLGNQTGGEAFELGKSAHPTGADSQLRSMYTQVKYCFRFVVLCSTVLYCTKTFDVALLSQVISGSLAACF